MEFTKASLQTVKGFLGEDEGEVLCQYARTSAVLGPVLEIGSYCGKSTLFLAQGCRPVEQVVFAVDHHRGSEEHQPGEEYHDESLMNQASGRFDSFPAFQNNIDRFGFGNSVIPIVCRSEVLGRAWRQILGMVFIDGGHSAYQAQVDCQLWAGKIAPGGVLAIHDIYLSDREGGQSPRDALAQVMTTNDFVWERKVGSLVLVRRRIRSPEARAIAECHFPNGQSTDRGRQVFAAPS